MYSEPIGFVQHHLLQQQTISTDHQLFFVQIQCIDDHQLFFVKIYYI